MAESTPSKPELRRILRERRNSLDSGIRQSATQALAHQLNALPRWEDAQHVALYAATEAEIGTQALIDACLAEGKHCYLPVIRPDKSLEFAHWSPGEPMSNNRYGIAEPLAGARRRPTGELDILFMPLLGWDHRGTRLGMGGGYYDRTLGGGTDAMLVGVSFSAQEVDYIPREAWDIGLDAVLTEAGVRFFSAAGGEGDY